MADAEPATDDPTTDDSTTDDVVLARLDRISALDRRGAPPHELLAELRGLIGDSEALGRTNRQAAEEVVERLRTALARDIIGA